MKIVKKIICFSMVGLLAISPVLSVNYSKAYSISDTLDDIVGICSHNVKNCIDTVANGLDTGWRIVNNAIDNIGNIFCPNRTTYTPSPGTQYTPYTTQTTSDNYTVNYYNIDNSNGTPTDYQAYNIYDNGYYDYTTNNYITNTTNITYNTTNNIYNTYNYEFNDNRVFITETYNSIVYTYVDTDTNTVDCYICSFELPNGDNSFNYTSGYCKGLYWVYNVVNYDYELDDNSILAYWRLDGDLHNEVPNSEFRLCYNPNSFGDGKFGSALRCDGPYDMTICHFNSNGVLSVLPNNFTITCWYFNGDPNYKAMSQGWHFLAWTWEGNTKRCWIDGVQCGVTENYAQSVLVYSGLSYDFAQVGVNNYVLKGYNDNIVVQKVSAYSPLKHTVFQSFSYLDKNSSNVYTISNCSNVPMVSYGTPFSNARSYDGNTYSGYGMDCPTPLHYPPVRSGGVVDFPWTGNTDIDPDLLKFGSISSSASTSVPVDIGYNMGSSTTTMYLRHGDTRLFYGELSSPTWSTVGYASRSLVHDGSYSYGRSIDITGLYEDKFDLFDRYDLSGCYFDEMIVWSGLKYADGSTIPIPTSRQELQVGYTAPSTVEQINDIAIQSYVPVNNYRIGGTIPTIANFGDVWFKLEDGYCTSCVQYYDGAWHPVNFGVYSAGQFRNGYTFNFYTLSFSNVDADVGSNPTSVINNYYSEVNNYLENNTTPTEKQSLFDFGTFIFGALASILVFLSSGIGTIFGFILPSWVLFPLLTFVPIISILLIAKLTNIFKK